MEAFSSQNDRCKGFRGDFQLHGETWLPEHILKVTSELEKKCMALHSDNFKHDKRVDIYLLIIKVSERESQSLLNSPRIKKFQNICEIFGIVREIRKNYEKFLMKFLKNLKNILRKFSKNFGKNLKSYRIILKNDCDISVKF